MTTPDQQDSEPSSAPTRLITADGRFSFGITDRHFQGKQCPDHPELIGWRRKNNGNCLACVRVKLAKYQASAAGKAKKVARYAKYYTDPEVKAQVAARMAAYRAGLENKARIAARMVEWYTKPENKARVAAQKVKYRAENKAREVARSAKYRAENKARIAEYQAEWGQLNPDKLAAKTARRRAAKLDRIVPWTDYEAISEVHTARVLTEARTGEAWHVDHFLPIQGESVCGLEVSSNLQLLTQQANDSKGNKFNEADFDHCAYHRIYAHAYKCLGEYATVADAHEIALSVMADMQKVDSLNATTKELT